MCCVFMIYEDVRAELQLLFLNLKMLFKFSVSVSITAMSGSLTDSTLCLLLTLHENTAHKRQAC